MLVRVFVRVVGILIRVTLLLDSIFPALGILRLPGTLHASARVMHETRILFHHHTNNNPYIFSHSSIFACRVIMKIKMITKI